MLSTGAENVQDQFVTSTQRGQQHAQELSSRSAKTNATQQSSGDTNGDHSAHESANQKAPLSKRTSEIRCHFIKIKLNGCACPPVCPSGLPLRTSPMRPLVQVPKWKDQPRPNRQQYPDPFFTHAPQQYKSAAHNRTASVRSPDMLNTNVGSDNYNTQHAIVTDHNAPQLQHLQPLSHFWASIPGNCKAYISEVDGGTSCSIYDFSPFRTMGHLVRAYLGMSCANCDWLSNVQLDATTASQRASLTNQSTIAYSVVQKLVTGGVKMLTTSALEKTRQQREPTTSLPIITTTHENFNHPFYVTGAGTTPADRGGCKIESSATSGDDTVPSKDHTQVTGRWQSPQTHPCADRPILSIDGRCLYKTGDQRHNKITTTKGCTIEVRTPRLLRFKKTRAVHCRLGRLLFFFSGSQGWWVRRELPRATW